MVYAIAYDIVLINKSCESRQKKMELLTNHLKVRVLG